jgi:hypothetical protein
MPYGARPQPLTRTVDNEGMMTGRILAALAASLGSLTACAVKDPLFCDATHPCSDPSRPYCDMTGDYEPNHIGRTCIASPFDAMPDAPPPDAMLSGAMLSVSEATHDFHDVQMGSESLPAQLVVTNTGQMASGTIALNVDGTNSGAFRIVPTGDSSDCAGKVLDAGGTCIVQVKYKPDASGAENGVLHVDASPGGMKIVGLSGNGLVPGSLEVTAGMQLTFADTRIQSMTAAQTITVHNKGGVPCTNLAVTLNDTTSYTKTSTTCGSNLGPNASCDVSVRFNPTTVGPHPSSVTITSDQGGVAPQLQGTGTGDVTVSKTGVGTIADTLGTPVISCGATCAGTYGQTPITLHATTMNGIPFNNWGGACASAGSNASCTLPLTQATTAVSANFGVCAPGTGMCTNGSLQTCDSTGHWGAAVMCQLGCYTDGTRCWDVDPSNGLAAALDDAKTQPSFTLGDNVQFDDGGNVVDGNGNVVPMKFKNGVYEVGSLTIGSATFKGSSDTTSPAAVIVSNGDVTINGVFNVVPALYGGDYCGAQYGDGLAIGGGGAQYAGAGGGSYGGAGARGGNNPTVMGSAPGVAGKWGAPTLVPLLGGCNGGLIVTSNPGVAWAGAGGGAIQIVSRTTIKVTGVLSAGGGGAPAMNGAAGTGTAGGGGGGAGGGILLEAPHVVLNGPTAGLAVNGGGGSSNCTTGAGQNGRPSTTPAAGGQCTGSTLTNGGNGAAGTTDATHGVDFSVGTNGYAGGGGGGLGYIRINTLANNGFTIANGAFTSGNLSTGSIGKR